MSVIELLLARKEVLISLIVVVLVLFSAIGLAVGPSISRRWKKAAAKRKAAREARQAELARKKKKPRRARAPKPEVVEVAEDEGDEDGEEDEEVAAVAAAVVATVEEKPVAAEKPAENPAVPPAGTPAPAAEAETPAEGENNEEKKEEEGTASMMQDILDSVFADEDVTAKYQVLLQGVEVGSAEELLEMANGIAARLGANQRKSQ